MRVLLWMLACAITNLAVCCQKEALRLLEDGWFSVGGRRAKSSSQRVDFSLANITVDGSAIRAGRKVYLMLNKPRGLVTTRRDPQERKTVYDCLPEDLPFVSPVGRLDKASESLLFLTNDTGWAEYQIGREHV